MSVCTKVKFGSDSDLIDVDLGYCGKYHVGDFLDVTEVTDEHSHAGLMQFKIIHGTLYAVCSYVKNSTYDEKVIEFKLNMQQLEKCEILQSGLRRTYERDYFLDPLTG
jgi:hypothetical protein